MAQKRSKGKTALKTAGKALKGLAKGALSAGAQILGAGAEALNPAKRRGRNSARLSAAQWANEMARLRDIKPRPLNKLYGKQGPTPEQEARWKDAMREWNRQYRHASKMQKIALEEDNAAFRARQQQNKSKRRRNSDHKDSDHPIEVVKHWRAGPPGYLTPWQRAHHAGQRDLFAHGIAPAKKRNPSKAEHDFYNKMLAILSRDPHDSHAVGAAQMAGKRLGYTAARIAKDIEKAKGKRRNAARTVHAARPAAKSRSGSGRQTGHKAKSPRARSVAKASKVSAERASNNPTRKGMRKLYREAKRISKTTRGRYFSSESGQRKAARHEKGHARKSKRNPSAESIRETFAGQVSGSRDLYFPKGTPKGLAKLGKLVLIETEEGTIKPVHGSAWLCSDTRGKLHIGSTTNAPLFDGPKRSLGKVKKIEYEDVKKHLGYSKPTIFFHHVGERNGIKPTLHADGKGGLVFKGGDYSITSRGLEN